MGDFVDISNASHKRLNTGWNDYNKFRRKLYLDLGKKQSSSWKSLKWSRIFICVFILISISFLVLSFTNIEVGKTSLNPLHKVQNFISGAVTVPFQPQIEMEDEVSGMPEVEVPEMPEQPRVEIPDEPEKEVKNDDVEDISDETEDPFEEATPQSLTLLGEDMDEDILTISAAPTQNIPILNSTLGTNLTSENLTCYPQNLTDGDGDAIYPIFNWYNEDVPIAVLNMPFDTNTSSTDSGAVKDYSSYSNNGTIDGAIWTDSGKIGGAYKFDGGTDYIDVGNDPSLNISSVITLMAWVKSDSEGYVVVKDPPPLPEKVATSDNSEGSNEDCGFWCRLTNLFAVERTITGHTVLSSEEQTNCPEGLVAYWNLDETSGTIAADAFGVNNGTLKNMAGNEWTTGKVNNSLKFDGSSDYVQIGDLGSINNWTVEFWMNSTSVSSNRGPLHTNFEDSVSVNVGVRFEHYDTGAFWIHLSGDADWYGHEIISNLAGDTWYHVVAVGNADGDNLKVYLNNVKEVDTAHSSWPTDFGNLVIGKQYSNESNRHFNGVVDELAIYNRTLSSDEISGHYDDGLAGDGYCEGVAEKLEVPFVLSTLHGGEFKVINDSGEYNVTTSGSVNDGAWHHLAATYNGSEMRLYIDGALNSSSTNYSGDLPTNEDNVWIGRHYDHSNSSNYFNGTMDDVRIYNESLSAEQIYQSYIEGLNGLNTSTIVSHETILGDNWTCEVTPNDLTGDGDSKNSTSLEIIPLDTTFPLITIVSPLNQTYDVLTVDFNISLNENGDWCGYSLNGSANISMTKLNDTYFNFTKTELADGKSYNINMNASLGYVHFSIDTTSPMITIVSPLNQTYLSSTVDFNVSLNEDGDWCGYSLNGTANVSMTKLNDTYFNFTKANLADESYNITFSCNDTSGNMNASSGYTYFSIDANSPVISVVSPTNGTTYSSSIVSFNVSLNEKGDWCGYSLNGTANVSMTKFNNTYFNFTKTGLGDGDHNITFSCNDTTGNMNASSGYVYFSIDTAPPIISVVSPTNGTTYSTSTVDFKVSLNENGDWCGYSLNGTANVSMTKFNDTYFNFTKTNFGDGDHNVTFSCNDTSGNMNASSGFTYFNISAALDTNISSCGVVLDHENTTYYVNESVINSSTTTCLFVDAYNITIDCQGNMINGTDYITVSSMALGIQEKIELVSGIMINRTELTNTSATIKNCIIKNYDKGVYTQNTSYNTFYNNTFWGNNDGIQISWGEDNIIEDNNFTENDGSGIAIRDSDYNTIINNTLTENSEGIQITRGVDNEIVDNIAQENSEQDLEIFAYSNEEECNNIVINLNGSNNLPIEFYNNTVDLSNKELSGLILCNASNSNIVNVTINSSHTLRNNQIAIWRSSLVNVENCTSLENEYGVYMWYVENSTINNNKFFNESSLAIYSTGGFNNTFSNNNLSSSQNGIRVYRDNSSKIFNNSIIENNYGIHLSDSYNGTIYRNIIGDSNDGGFYISSNSEGNIIYNNLLNNTQNILFDNAGANDWNTTQQAGTRISSNGTDIGGNYWTNSSATGYSDTCIDLEGDGFCDAAYNLTENNIDYLALSNEFGNVNAPTIPIVTVNETFSPLEGSVREIEINFTVNDVDGYDDINVSSLVINFSRSGEDNRLNSSCLNITASENETNFSCLVDMYYFDGAGDWNVSITIKDDGQAPASNNSVTFTYGEFTGIVLSPLSIGWSSIDAGAVDQVADNSTLINNTGNVDIVNISVKAINLLGAQDSNYIIYAENFTASNESVAGLLCDSGSGLTNDTEVNVTGTVLAAGNLSSGQGQEEIFYCLNEVPSPLMKQSYSTSNAGAWIVKIYTLLALFSLGRKRKKLSKKQEIIIKELEVLKTKYNVQSDDLISLMEEEREEIVAPVSIFNVKLMGPSEALVKYLKEMRGMKLSQIANLLNRDDRTIWLTYNHASLKKEKLIIKKAGEVAPVSIFSDRKLSILESLVKYLQGLGMSNLQIAELTGKDQRNIGTLKVRIKKKLKMKNG